MTDMHKMLMPYWEPPGSAAPDPSLDSQYQSDPHYPQNYQFSVPTAKLYHAMPDFFQKTFTSFGTDKKTAPPKKEDVPQLPATFNSAQNQVGSFSNYASVAMKLNQAFSDLSDSDTALVPLINPKTADISTSGQAAINATIDSISDAAPTVPPSGMSEDDYIITYLDKAITAAKTAVDKATTQHNATASTVDDQTKQIQQLEQQIKDLQAANAKLQQELDSGGAATGPSYDPSALDPSSTNTNDTPGWTPLDMGASGFDGSTLGGSTGDSSLGGSLGNGLTDGTNGGSSNLGSTVPASVDSGGTAGSGMGDLLSSMLPMMMMQQQQRGLGDGLGDQSNSDRLDPNRERNYPAAMAPPAAGPSSTPPTQPAQPAQSQPAPQGASGPAQPGAPAPRTPGADGLVTYTFPDGRTQKVSPTVAQALDAAFSNNAGTDAQAAYSKTPAKWTDNKQIGTRVDPSQLKTGDVATWDGSKTAILVVWSGSDASAGVGADPGTGTDPGAAAPDSGSGTSADAGGSGSLQLIVDGQLVPFNEQVSGKSGDFGAFAGFAHPNNIDATGTATDPSSSAGMPTPAASDPSAPADPSAAAPAVAGPVS